MVVVLVVVVVVVKRKRISTLQEGGIVKEGGMCPKRVGAASDHLLTF